MIPIWALWTVGGVTAVALYEKFVKKEAHPLAATAAIPAHVRQKVATVIATSTNVPQLKALGTALAAKGDPAAAAALNKAAAIEQTQAPFARTISEINQGGVRIPSVPRAGVPTFNPPAAVSVPIAVPSFQTPAVVAPSGQVLIPPVQVSPGVFVQPPASQTIPPTIRQGSTGANVVRWQKIIGTTPDGQFGPKTKAATMGFQATHRDSTGANLIVDGVVGPKTWSSALSSIPGA
jgi:peptidoglycan hydrolase-like protein with peptidoglycan-binding domain